MSNKYFNKCAVETLLSVWWFFVIALIGLGIVTGVLMYYGTNIDVRGIEASVMSEKLSSCISNNGFLNYSLIESVEEIYSFCGLNKDFFDEKGFLYFSIRVFDSDKFVAEVSSGLAANEKDCQVSRNVMTRNYPVCFQKNETMSYDGKNVELLITTVSNQVGGQGKLG